MVDAIRWLNHYPDEEVCFVNTFPLASSVIYPFKDLGMLYSDLQCTN